MYCEFINLLIVPLSLFFVSLWITRQLNKRDEREKEAAIKIKELVEKSEKEKEESIRERWDSFTKVQCDIKNKVNKLVDDMHKKVDYEYCKNEHDGLEERLRKVGG